MNRSTLPLLALLTLASSARATPPLGAPRPDVRLRDAWDRPLDLARIGPVPVLVLYEDKESSEQNHAFKDDLAALAKGDLYRSAVSLVPIADVESYDYWPVRGFVKDAIRDQSRRFGADIYCDWDGAARVALRLRRHVSNIVLFGRDGRVLFAHEGSMGPGERREVIVLLRKQVEG